MWVLGNCIPQILFSTRRVLCVEVGRNRKSHFTVDRKSHSVAKRMGYMPCIPLVFKLSINLELVSMFPTFTLLGQLENHLFSSLFALDALNYTPIISYH